MEEEVLKEGKKRMKSDKHLFCRTIERNLNKTEDGFVDNDFSVWANINENSKISELLHMVFDYEAGDTYAWPCDNITKQEIDKLWEEGQRAFVLIMSGYKEIIIYDLKIITQDEYMSFIKKEKETKKDLITKLTEVVNELSEPELSESDLQHVSKDIEKIINENNQIN